MMLTEQQAAEGNYINPERSQNVDFQKIKLGLASPEKIREWSHGEVKKLETYSLLTNDKEVSILKELASFEQILVDICKYKEVNILCNYAYRLASLFHSYYKYNLKSYNHNYYHKR